MIKYLPHKEIDKQKWDSCILESRNGLIYGCSWYLDSVCPGWDALVEDNYISVMPLPIRQKFGFFYVFRPVFTQQLGVFSTDTINEKKVSAFLNSIPQKFKYVNFSANYACNFNVPEFKFAENTNCKLDIKNIEYIDIFKNYSSNHKRNLKKAQGFNLKLKKGTLDELISFKLKNNEKHVHVTEEELAIFKKLAQNLLNTPYGEIVCVYSPDNVLLAAAFLTIFRNQITYLLPVSSSEGKEKRAMFFLIDEYIKDHLFQYLTFDFEGSNIPNVAAFYEGFGAKPEKYPSIISNRLPWYAKWLK